MPFNPELCRDCILDGQYTPTRPNGHPDAPYLIITDKPSPNCAKAGIALADGYNRMLMKHMNEEGFNQDDFQYHPAVLCPFDAERTPNIDKKKIVKVCRHHLEDFIEENPHLEAIIPLGAEAASQAFGKPTKITKVRGLGNFSPEFQMPIFPVQHPMLACKYPQNEPILAADCASFGRLIDAGLDIDKADEFVTGEYTEVDDLQFLVDELEANPDIEIIAFDTEATGLRWYQEGVDVRTYREGLHKDQPWFKPRFQILTMQFTIREGQSYVLVWDHPERPVAEEKKPKLRNQIRKLLCDPRRIVVGQHLKFDQVALWKTEGIRFPVGGDTQMLAAIHDENLPEKNLDVLTKIYVPAMAGYADRFNATVDKSKMWQTPIKTIIPYGGGDTDASYRLYEVLEDLVSQDAGNWNHYIRVSIPGLNAFGAMETTGMIVDTEDALPEFQEYLTAEVDKAKASLLTQVPKIIKRDHLSDPRLKSKPPEEILSFSRASFIKDILFDHPSGFRLKPVVFTKTTDKLDDHLREPSVSTKDHLPYFYEKCPFTFELAEYVKDATLLRNNVVSFQEKFVVNGMVRPTYSLAKAVTRRSSSADPNGQNFPKRGEKAKKYQRIFKSKPGYFVISRDLSQAELRIAGEMARDPVITRIYQEDGDIHVSTACIVMNVSEAQFKLLDKKVQKDGRQKAKAVNFGFIYGMGWRKFIGYAKTQYGVTFSENEAKRIRDAFFTKYKGLKRWHDNTREYAMKHGFVRSFSGLVRHLPMINSTEEYVQQEAVRQAINSPVQEFGSTLGVIALGRMNLEVDPDYLEIIGFIHDAIYAYVKCEYLEWGLKTLGYYMESTPIREWFGHDMQIPIKSDPSFGLNMGDVFELEDFPRDNTAYNWHHKCLNDKDGNLAIEVPRQQVPPNNGRLRRSPYTLPTDLEPENVSRPRPLANMRPGVQRRRRPVAEEPQEFEVTSVVKRRARPVVEEEPVSKVVRRKRA
jgi:DNA polymerase I-like protein with 3'-5' exonuclease and polymerase domains